jgi:hypothetical protein
MENPDARPPMDTEVAMFERFRENTSETINTIGKELGKNIADMKHVQEELYSRCEKDPDKVTPEIIREEFAKLG